MKYANVVGNTVEGFWDTMEDVWDMMEDVWDTMENISYMAEGIWNVTEDLCTGCLIWAAHKSCSRNDYEEVEEDTERGDPKDN